MMMYPGLTNMGKKEVCVTAFGFLWHVVGVIDLKCPQGELKSSYVMGKFEKFMAARL